MIAIVYVVAITRVIVGAMLRDRILNLLIGGATLKCMVSKRSDQCGNHVTQTAIATGFEHVESVFSIKMMK